MALRMSHKTLYDVQGYVVIPNLIAPEDRHELEKACDRTIRRTRNGLWPHRRTVGRQFPPYDNDDPDSWGVQHLMHPDLKEPAFVRWYTSSLFLQAITELLDCNEKNLQMGEQSNIAFDVIRHLNSRL